MSNEKVTVKPGEVVPASGIYREVGPRGGQPSPSQTTLVEGHPAPPSSKPGRQFELEKPAVHKPRK